MIDGAIVARVADMRAPGLATAPIFARSRQPSALSCQPRQFAELAERLVEDQELKQLLRETC